MPSEQREQEKKPMPEQHECAVKWEALRWRCDPLSLSFESTEEVEPVAGVVGQETAVEALRFGLLTRAPGQNIFVRGLTGTGRYTLVRRLLDELRLSCPQVRDRCYVHNFAQPDRPCLLVLASGKGPALRDRVEKLADFIRDDLDTALSSEGIRSLKTAADRTASKRLKKLIEPFEQKLKDVGLTLVSVEAGPIVQSAIFPIVDDHPVPPDAFEDLHTQGEISEEDYRSVRDDIVNFEPELAKIGHEASDIRRTHDEAVKKIMEYAARTVLSGMVESIADEFSDPKIQQFLEAIVDDVVRYRLDSRDDEHDFTRMYRVNVVLEHGTEEGCPVIVENVPTERNLRGSIDFDFEAGDEPRPSHMGIRAGSLLRADGGYLILKDRDLLSETTAWRMLLRTLRTGRLEITPVESQLAVVGPMLKPEPIEINVKVILLGDAETYAMLDAFDADFPHLFKVLADFDSTIPRDAAGVNHYAAVVSRIVQQEGLPPFDRTAVAALAEHGARIASQRNKLTARFGRLADIAREAAFLVQQTRKKLVTGEHIREAVRRGKDRGILPSRHFCEMVGEGTIQLATSGKVVGQINGLAVMQAGPLIYGFPTRITATIGPGEAGVINVEREAELSGSIHTKGFYILRGLLRYLLRTEHPLTFDASIAFEQSYGGIDGDSASGAEICCLLSALTDIPIRQDIAMTGAIDQLGHIMPIGAVNEKIEGFYDACHEQGITGTQGVIIPKSNAGDLMLKHAMLDDCQAGKFNVYAVENVHEALEVLTGCSAGTPGPDGKYPAGSILAIAVQKARDYWEKASGPQRRRAGDYEAKRV